MQRITCHDIAAYSYRYRQQCRANRTAPSLQGIIEFARAQKKEPRRIGNS